MEDTWSISPLNQLSKEHMSAQRLKQQEQGPHDSTPGPVLCVGIIDINLVILWKTYLRMSGSLTLVIVYSIFQEQNLSSICGPDKRYCLLNYQESHLSKVGSGNIKPWKMGME